ncbi:uncharacterized protein N7496_006085 [Penicillium cataractarum]|uniref:Uncharacterized protein n=1 Tax=Penicillium cataractarum TaxID=2100454 RepID=A0A9W9S0X3_9EURO|nr:uncharacterized protein N7496_006085 [Penicillium cataractarum]KAJ5369993.1 hypothetical protein N7496_006085 [Penicillium cataractarum]
MFHWDPAFAGFTPVEPPATHYFGTYPPLSYPVSHSGPSNTFHQGIQGERCWDSIVPQPARQPTTYRPIMPRPSPAGSPERTKKRKRNPTERSGKRPVQEISMQTSGTISKVNDTNKDAATEPSTPEDAEMSVETLQRSLKTQALQSIAIFRTLIESLREYDLDVETLNCWEAEIGDTDASYIPVKVKDTSKVFVSLQELNSVLITCFGASDPERHVILRAQALRLLNCMLIFAVQYHLLHTPGACVEIGKWMERLCRDRSVTQGQ